MPGICHPLFCLCVSCWFELVAGWDPFSVSLNDIMTAITVCTAALFTITLNPSDSAILIWLQIHCCWLWYYGVLLPGLFWDFYSWYHVMLLAFYAITKVQLLTLFYQMVDYKYASEWIYCKLTVLYMTMVYIHSWHTYGHGLFSLLHMIILVISSIHICTCLILYINGGNTSPMWIPIITIYLQDIRVLLEHMSLYINFSLPNLVHNLKTFIIGCLLC